MKKVLLIVQGCRQGGANRSLQYLLEELKNSSLQPSVFALSHQGPYREVFAGYNLLNEDFLCSTLLSDLSQEAPSLRRLYRWLLRSVFRLLRIAGIPSFSLFFFNARRKIERRHFDVVIAFQESTATAFAAALRVEPKIAWIHSDYGNYLKQAGSRPEEKLYQNFRHIVCVSEFTAGVFKQVIPSQAPKVSSIPNIMAQDSIRSQAQLPVTNDRFQPEGATLLCVGRLDPVKQFTAIPALAAAIKNKGIRFRWFLIGGGPATERNAIMTAIEKYEVSDVVVLLGETDNPYPYIARADLMISLSLSEACPLGIQEAKILHVPVVSTDFGSAAEFVIPGEGGKIIPLAAMAEELIQLLTQPHRIGAMKQELANFNFDNQHIVRKIENLVIQP